jgi:hypothetical protein
MLSSGQMHRNVSIILLLIIGQQQSLTEKKRRENINPIGVEVISDTD